MNQISNITKQFNNDLFLKRLKNEKVKNDLRVKILSAHYARVYNKYTRSDVALSIGVSESTIKRLEKGEVYNIDVIYNYITLLKDLPVRKKKVIPKWIL